jgi:hypothetical protein
LCQQLKVSLAAHTRSSHIVLYDEYGNLVPFWNDDSPTVAWLDIDKVIAFGPVINPSVKLKNTDEL